MTDDSPADAACERPRTPSAVGRATDCPRARPSVRSVTVLPDLRETDGPTRPTAVETGEATRADEQTE